RTNAGLREEEVRLLLWGQSPAAQHRHRLRLRHHPPGVLKSWLQVGRDDSPKPIVKSGHNVRTRFASKRSELLVHCLPREGKPIQLREVRDELPERSRDLRRPFGAQQLTTRRE